MDVVTVEACVQREYPNSTHVGPHEGQETSRQCGNSELEMTARNLDDAQCVETQGHAIEITDPGDRSVRDSSSKDTTLLVSEVTKQRSDLCDGEMMDTTDTNLEKSERNSGNVNTTQETTVGNLAPGQATLSYTGENCAVESDLGGNNGTFHCQDVDSNTKVQASHLHTLAEVSGDGASQSGTEVIVQGSEVMCQGSAASQLSTTTQLLKAGGRPMAAVSVSDQCARDDVPELTEPAPVDNNLSAPPSSPPTHSPPVFPAKSSTKSHTQVTQHQSTSESSLNTDSAPCRILTKYVFINSSHKGKIAKKKKKGFVCSKSFRHSLSLGGKSRVRKMSKSVARINKKNRVTKAKQNERPVPSSALRVVKSEKEADSDTDSQSLVESMSPAGNEETQDWTSLLHSALRTSRLSDENGNRAREARRVAREAKRNSTASSENPIRVKFKSKTAVKKGRGVGKVRVNGVKPVKGKEERKKKQKYLKLEDKLEVIWAMEAPTATVNNVAQDFEMDVSVVRNILKHKEELLERVNTREGRRKEDRRRRTERQKRASRKQEKEKEKEAGTERETDFVDRTVVKMENLIFGECLDADNAELDVDTGIMGKKVLRKELTLDEKVQIVKILENPDMKMVHVAHKFGVSRSAVSRIHKKRHLILARSVNGVVRHSQKRARECREPELDRALLRWYQAIEVQIPPASGFAVSNTLLKEKACELSLAMGKTYQPQDSWIIRWKNRHSLTSKMGLISDKAELRGFDEKVNLAEILAGAAAPDITLEMLEKMKAEMDAAGPDPRTNDLYICEHCGVLTNRKKKKENNHIAGCPSAAFRKDLTLEQKVHVVRALERPGVTMVALAKKYGVSPSAISRINKNRVDILARRASGFFNSKRKRERRSQHPDVERMLVDWFRGQQELGVHVSGSMIRDKAKDFAQTLGKDFWPSDSWVFRWRQRNNVNALNSFVEEDEDDDVEEIEGEGEGEGGDEKVGESLKGEEDGEPVGQVSMVLQEGGEEVMHVDSHGQELGSKRKRKLKATAQAGDGEEVVKKEKRPRLPRLPLSVMCEKCGFVSPRLKNNRIKSLRHAKGCPDQKVRHEFTYKDRVRMIKALEEPGATLSSVARQFGVSVSSMSRMNQKKDAILTHGVDHGGQKRIRDCKEPEVAVKLFQWFSEKKSEGVHVTGPKLKEKARKLAAEMGREFRVSSGWLGRWKHRYHLVGTSHTAERSEKEPAKRRKGGKKRSVKSEDNVADPPTFQPAIHVPDSVSHHSEGGEITAQVILDNGTAAPLQPQGHPVFIHQRFQNPWGEITAPTPANSLWPKEFLHHSGGSAVVSQEEGNPSFSYSDSGSLPSTHTVLHSVIDSFSGMTYQVPMTVNSNMAAARDFLKPDEDVDKTSNVTPVSHGQQSSHRQHQHHHHHQPPPVSSQLVTHMPAPHSQQILLHHQGATPTPSTLNQSQHARHLPAQQPPARPHPPMLTHHPPQPAPTFPTARAVPSPENAEEEHDQQRQVMEAFKIMSSFADKKSLGDDVKAALRTIEMSMKGQNSGTPDRGSFATM